MIINKVLKILLKFLKDEEGASMAEYALLLGIIMIVIATVINTFRGDLTNTFTNTGNAISQ